jgi:hypothetical protein
VAAQTARCGSLLIFHMRSGEDRRVAVFAFLATPHHTLFRITFAHPVISLLILGVVERRTEMPMRRRISIAVCIFSPFLSLLLEPAVLNSSADAAPARIIKRVHLAGPHARASARCRRNDAQTLRASCASNVRPTGPVAPSVTCVDAPSGFALRGPPRPYAPIFRLCV